MIIVIALPVEITMTPVIVLLLAVCVDHPTTTLLPRRAYPEDPYDARAPPPRRGYEPDPYLNGHDRPYDRPPRPRSPDVCMEATMSAHATGRRSHSLHFLSKGCWLTGCDGLFY
jgi:hypothetical protein